MTFTKENAKEIGRRGGNASRAKNEAWKSIVMWLVGEGGDQFRNLISKLASGQKIAPEQKEFINHYKDLLEFHQPKLSRNQNINEFEKDSLKELTQLYQSVANAGRNNNNNEGVRPSELQE